MQTKRVSDYPIEPLLLHRWSPRAMSGEPVAREEFMRLLEAARWAPSSYNNQPWRFVYGFKGTPAWDTLFSLLTSANQEWAKNSAVLVLVISANFFSYNQKECLTHTFDTGAACENFALQGSAQGLVVHGMAGFDYQAARSTFHISDRYTIEAMFCVGKPGDPRQLSERCRACEIPSDRMKVSQIAFEGEFKDTCP